MEALRNLRRKIGRFRNRVVAKRRDSVYGPGVRGWVKVKNRAYWRFGQEPERAGSSGSKFV